MLGGRNCQRSPHRASNSKWNRRLLTEPNNERKNCALTEFCTAWFFNSTAVATGLAPKYEAVRHIYLVGSKAKNGYFGKIFENYL